MSSDIEFTSLPPVQYRVRIELYLVEDPDTVILREDGPAETPSDIISAAAVVMRRSQDAIAKHEAMDEQDSGADQGL